MGLAGAAIGVGTTINVLSAQQQKEQAKAVAKFNERVAIRNAAATRAAGTEEQFQERQDLKQVLARNRALTAAGGVQQVGSPIQAQLSVIDEFATSIATIGFNAEVTARNFEQQAEIARMQRRTASAQGRLAIGSALVGGAADITAIQRVKPTRKSKRKGTISAEQKIGPEGDIL